MFKITDEINGEKKPKTFHVTRGDYGIIEISAKMMIKQIMNFK